MFAQFGGNGAQAGHARESMLQDTALENLEEAKQLLNKELGYPEECLDDPDYPAMGDPMATAAPPRPAKLVDPNALPESDFIEEVKILFIPGADQRLICYFLGSSAAKDIKTSGETTICMISQLKMQSQIAFMESRGYKFVEEVNIDEYGNRIGVGKHTWNANKKPIVFTTTGYLFFQHHSGDKSQNIVMHNMTGKGMGAITCYATNESFAGLLMNDLAEFAKHNNALRGVKMRDIDMLEGTYEEIRPQKEYTWDTFYYPQRVRDLFELEVFGFLANTKKYNDKNIYRRGLLLHGNPGTGKTSIGHIICHYAKDATVIWLTPDIAAGHDGGKASIKNLYKLADYLSPAVIILEDIDLFSEDRENISESVRLGTLMNILDGVDSVVNSVTVAMTNRLSLIEKALTNRPGRFDRIVEIPELNNDLRRRMLESRLEDCYVDDETMDHIVSETEGWTGAHIQEFVLSVNMHFIKEDDTSREVTMNAANDALEQMNYFSNGSKVNGKKKAMGFVNA